MIFANETDKIWDVGYISGTFDMFHIGHLNLIRRTKERCIKLIVGVLADDVVKRTKKKWPIHPLVDRMAIVAALKYVDEVDITTEELLRKDSAWEKYRFNAMFSGDDHIQGNWTNKREQKALDELGVDLVFFPYTKETSSTILRELITK